MSQENIFFCNLTLGEVDLAGLKALITNSIKKTVESRTLIYYRSEKNKKGLIIGKNITPGDLNEEDINKVLEAIKTGRPVEIKIPI